MKKVIYIMAAALILFAGCRSSKSVAPRFFMLEYPADKQIADTLVALPFTLEITEVDVHPAYSTSQIAIREGTHEVKYFVNHQWSARPHQSLGRFISAYFSNHAVFEHADDRFWNVQPDFKLYTLVHNLELKRDRKDYYAHLHLEFWLESAQGERIAIHNSDESRLLEKRDLNLFATAVNDMFFEELNFFAQKIHFELSPE